MKDLPIFDHQTAKYTFKSSYIHEINKECKTKIVFLDPQTIIIFADHIFIYQRFL